MLPQLRAFAGWVVCHSMLHRFEAWTRNTVWSKLVAICVNQLQVEPNEVEYLASFSEDLGCRLKR